MELLNNPQFHSTFASLGTLQADIYVVNDECLSILEEINCKLLMEDHTLRTYRRAIGFGQNVKKDIIPLLINIKDSQIIDSAVRLMVNLTVPIECLLSAEVMIRTDIGRHTIYELNHLLYTSKEVFVDTKVTKSIIDHMKNILETDHKLSIEECESVSNCLLLLRNILHIPENVNNHHQHQQHQSSMQNQILWNLFTQSIDKLLIYLMTCPQKSYWGVTIVQLIALMYKDQHVGTLQKLLNHWFEAASHSESTEDNESNTSPPKQCSGDSSPMLTSDPTSDSSDNGSGKMTTISDGQDNENVRMSTSDYQGCLIRIKPKPNSAQNSIDSIQSTTSLESSEYLSQDIIMKSPEPSTSSSDTKNQKWSQKTHNNLNGCRISSKQKVNNNSSVTKNKKQHYSSNNQSELSDYGYVTQVSQSDLQGEQNKETISTSSNDDDSPKPKPAHQKPPSTNQKQRFNAAQKQRIANAANTPAVAQEKKDARRKKLVKRSRSSIINMKGLIHHTPTDEDISNILKEFTVDFLLKGYGSLVQELHAQLLTDIQLSIDTSHFFWLVTYFLKFAAQLELDLEHINSVLSFSIISYLTYEGVNICEQLELTSRQQGTDLKPYLRRIHLVVTAIREFLQALDLYKRNTHLSPQDKEHIKNLQTQISLTEDLRHLFVLLLRCYNPSFQSRQYLQDLVITNHILLLLMDNVSKNPDDNFAVINMVEHIKQFATVEIMYQYGVLLENFQENGEFVNNCIFTMMHHIGGDLNQVAILFQPNILKTYSQIWENEYEICDDWSDLIEYVIHKFINTPPKPQIVIPNTVISDGVSISDVWAQEEMDALYWYYVQSKKTKDIVGSILKQIVDSGHKRKSRIAVIQQLLQQDIISLAEYDDLMQFEDSQFETEAIASPSGDSRSKEESGIDISDNSDISAFNQQPDDIKVLLYRLLKENKGKLIAWLQHVLIECCFIKLNLYCPSDDKATTTDTSIEHPDNTVMEPISHHCILKKKSIPLVPYNAEQNRILVYQPFVLLLHKLGFHLPADANKLFVRIPEFWTADFLFTIAEKLGPIPKDNMKFDIARLRKCSDNSVKLSTFTVSDDNSSHSLPAPALNVTSSQFDVQRYTPEVNTNQNWLQMIIQSKTSISERATISTLPQPTLQLSSSIMTSSSTGHSFLQPIEPPKKSGVNGSAKSGSSKVITKDIDMTVESDDYEFTDDVVHEVIDSYETNSAASSFLMYVSDEEEKHDIS